MSTIDPSAAADPGITGTPPTPRTIQRRIVIALIVLLVLPVVYVLGLVLFVAEGTSRTIALESDAPGVSTRLDVLAQVLAIDPIRGEMTLRLAIYPEGALLAPDGLTMAEDVVLFVNAASGTPDRLLAQGRPPTAQDVVLSLYGGDVSNYPFDDHLAEFAIQATRGGPGADRVPVPVTLNFEGAMPGYSISAELRPDDIPGFLLVELGIGRAPTTVGFAVFIMIVQWALAIGLIAVVLNIYITQRKLEVGLLGWMGAMLFAFPALRNAAPNTPPIGTLSDFLAFFWAEAIVAVCLAILVGLYLSRRQ